jgi:dolichyl-phosphate beta-glucosyltransferase
MQAAPAHTAQPPATRGHAPALSLVIPAFNEEARLPAFLDASLAWMCEQGRDFELIVVDDGSRDRTGALVLERCARFPQLRLVTLESNRGKGAAVRAGMMAARGERRLFADADGATTLLELSRLERALDQGADIAVGSREGGSDTRVVVSARRRVLGRWFNRAVRMGAIRGIRDTQCGFKLFTAKAAQSLFPLLRENGFAFDVESLYLAGKLGLSIAEVPVNWTEIPGSKVRLLRDGWRMLKSVLKIRWRWRRGVYAHPNPEVLGARERAPA